MFAFTELKKGDLLIKIHKGIIHLVCNHNLGFSDPPPLPNRITFSTECNKKLPFFEHIHWKVQVWVFQTVSCHFNRILILFSSLTRDVSFYCLGSVNVSGYMFSYLASRHANYPLFFSNVFFCIHPHQKMYACIEN